MKATPLVLAATCCALLVTALPGSAQSLGIFRWQLQPYCNVVALTVTQNGGIYTLDGSDDQCGSAQAAVTGLAFVNPDGSIGFGLTIVSAPGAAPVHVTATVSLPTVSGSWRDSAGRQGPFVLTPGAGTGGNPRPTGGSLGSGTIDPTQVQVRVAAACPAGQAMVGVGQDGTVSCTTVGGGGAGDITAVVAGAGLIGGATSGDATLAVNFGGPGSASSVARSDHTHERGVENVTVGYLALGALTTGNANSAIGTGALRSLTTGTRNTAVGTGAMFSATGAYSNAALGYQALNSSGGGGDNTAIGFQSMLGSGTVLNNTAIGSLSLRSQSSGDGNVAVGYRSLYSVSGASSNTAVGTDVLVNLATGGFNTAVGALAGSNLVNGANNLYLGNEGVANEGATIRVGSGLWHTRLFLGATRGVSTGLNNAIPVLIDSQGQLGTLSSSRRTKEDIQDLGEAGTAVQRLRPVRFRYITPFADGSTPVQYGLIAEEVEEVLPELVAYGDDGRPESVKYHILPTLLVAEVQRLQREIAALRATVDALQQKRARR